MRMSEARPWQVDVLSLHPEMLEAPLTTSILGRAARQGIFEARTRNIRDHAGNKHGHVDDTPYGGGAGMVLRVDVVARAIESVRRPDSHVLLTSPRGRVFSQAMARELASRPHVVIVTGHYEGIDDRIRHVVDEEVSLGDVVLTGGELCALVMIDAAVRLLPGALGNEASALDESFSSGLLEYSQYTRPRSWRGHEVPEVLVSGHHGRIEAWRKADSQRVTAERRPDLWVDWCATHGINPHDVDTSGPKR